MLTNNGFVKIFRKITKWEWYKNSNTCHLFIHLLLTANYEDSRFEGRTIKRGQCLTTLAKLAEETGMSLSAVRTALEHLKKTGELNAESTNKFSVITLNNYAFYQDENALSDKHSSDASHPDDDRITTNSQQLKKDKENIRRIKKRERGALAPHGIFSNVFLSDSEVEDLRSKYPNDFDGKVERLSCYMESSGREFGNHYAVLISWLNEDCDSDRSERKASYDISKLDEFNSLDNLDELLNNNF